jgi:hypothetical protein
MTLGEHIVAFLPSPTVSRPRKGTKGREYLEAPDDTLATLQGTRVEAGFSFTSHTREGTLGVKEHRRRKAVSS